MICKDGYQDFLKNIINDDETVIHFNENNTLQFYCNASYYIIFEQLMKEGYVTNIQVKKVYPEIKIIDSKIIDVSIYNNCCLVKIYYNKTSTSSVKTIDTIFKHNQIINLFEFNKYKNFIQESNCSIKILGTNKFRILFPKDKMKIGSIYFADGNDNCTYCKYYDFDYHNNVEICEYQKQNLMMAQSHRYICDYFVKKRS